MMGNQVTVLAKRCREQAHYSPSVIEIWCASGNMENMWQVCDLFNETSVESNARIQWQNCKPAGGIWVILSDCGGLPTQWEY